MSALYHCSLCAMTTGAARLIHDLDRSGSTVALGATYRLVTPMGT